jgi:hypothetical protein
MKQILIICLLIPSIAFCQSKQQDIYRYYFINGRPTGKFQIEVAPEKGILYSDIDSLVVSKREKNKKGVEEVEPKIYNTFSEFFNAMGAAGLEFVNYYKWNTAGGMTGMVVGRVDGDYFIFRKRIVTDNAQ